MKKQKGNKTLITLISIILIILISAGIWFITVESASRSAAMITLNGDEAPQKSEYLQDERNVSLGGLTLHYSVCGHGYPLLLLHGNGGNHHDFDDVISYLSNDFQVYALDSRCQGESSTDEISYELMAQDVAGFIDALGIVRPIVVGHSDGGIVGLLVAINYPEMLSGLIACGANSVPNGLKWYSLLETKIAYGIKKDALDKLMIDEPNITSEDLNKISIPTYIVAGEFDVIKLSDTKFIAENIQDCDLAVVKFATHSSYLKNGKKGYVLITSWINQRFSNLF